MIRILQRLAARVMARAPDFIIGGHDNPYMLRWWVIPRNRLFNIYLHQILRDDDDRALHDHPWVNCSILLEGSYVEHTIAAGGIHVRKIRKAGAVVLRRATAAHRLELVAGQPCRSLFLTGPRIREWGFHCPRGWILWKAFTAEDDSGAIGAGCDGKVSSDA